MTRFIKLSNIILNTRHINRILIRHDKFIIYLMNYRFDGTMVLGIGSFSSEEEDEIKICAKKDPVDYKLVSEWITKIEK